MNILKITLENFIRPLLSTVMIEGFSLLKNINERDNFDDHSKLSRILVKLMNLSLSRGSTLSVLHWVILIKYLKR